MLSLPIVRRPRSDTQSPSWTKLHLPLALIELGWRVVLAVMLDQEGETARSYIDMQLAPGNEVGQEQMPGSAIAEACVHALSIRHRL